MHMSCAQVSLHVGCPAGDRVCFWEEWTVAASCVIGIDEVQLGVLATTAMSARKKAASVRLRVDAAVADE